MNEFSYDNLKTLNTEALIAKIEKLKKENNTLKEEIDLLKKDPLTNVFTRRYLDELIEEKYIPKLNNRTNWYYNVYLIDLNNLHDINRKQGFEKGDEYIKNSINFIKQIFNNFKASYKIFRIGGDEFIAISQPYDYIPLEFFKNPNFEIVYTEWDKNMKFKDVMKKLDNELIKLKNKRNDKKISLCRNCILKKYPELYEQFLIYIDKKNKKEK